MAAREDGREFWVRRSAVQVVLRREDGVARV